MRLAIRPIAIARLCAAFALILGATILVGWALHVPRIVQVRPDWTPMVVNTAIGFVLGGVGMLFAGRRRGWPARVAAVFAVLVALLAVEELCVLVFDISPAFSQPELHRPLQQDYPHPGRMAPNAAMCFLLYGIGLLALVRPHRRNVAAWVQHAAEAMIAIGLLGVVGYALQLEYLYAWTDVVRMAIHTGAGMIVLGWGLWNMARARAGGPPAMDGKEVAGVQRVATWLLLVASISAGIGGFAFLQGQVQRQMREDLVHMVADREELFDQVVDDRDGRARVAAGENDLPGLVRAVSLAPRDPAPLAALRAWATPLRADGFSSIGFDASGRHWQLDGQPARPELSVALRGRSARSLLWSDGFVLRNELPVRDDAGPIGTLIIEQPLPALTETSAIANRIGDTGELAVCGADAVAMHCFPLRSRARPFSIPRSVGGPRLPMEFALHRDSGSIVALDYRKQRVLAAFGPIGATGLGLVVKRDIAEVYAPIRRQFQRIVVFLAALLLFGLWLLRRRLHPLLHVLEDSRALAVANSARFEAAVESNLDAFYILECMRDRNGAIQDMRYVLLNARGEQVLGRSRASVIGHGMCELFSVLRSDGMLEHCIRVVETGEPLVIERSSIVRKLYWYQMQLVRIADGVGMTVRDITVARIASEEIRRQAFHDPLTGLANRAGFELALAESIGQSVEHVHVGALALLDLDGFKRINDDLGHAAGDQVLQQVATRLRDCLRPSDTVARLGGDEFVLVLSILDYPDGAQVVARKLVALIAQPMQVEGHTVGVTVSVGICAFPRDGSDAASLLKSADHAMYRAKRAGRNGYFLHGLTPH